MHAQRPADYREFIEYEAEQARVQEYIEHASEPVAPHTSRTYREWDGEVRFLRADFPGVDAIAEELGIPKDWDFGFAERVKEFAKRTEQFRPTYHTPEEIADMIRRGVFRFDRLDVAEWDASTGTFKLQRFP